MTIYADYRASDYDGAETSADRYLKEYANSAEADYVQYLQANSYYEQIPDISRDQAKPSRPWRLSRRWCRSIPNRNMSKI